MPLHERRQAGPRNTGRGIEAVRIQEWSSLAPDWRHEVRRK